MTSNMSDKLFALRKTVQDVIMDNSFERGMFTGATFEDPGMISSEVMNAHRGMAQLPRSSPCLSRPPVTFRMTTNEILLAAIAEKRLLNQARAVAFRKQALAEGSFQSNGSNQSLCALLLSMNRNPGFGTFSKNVESSPKKDLKGSLEFLGSTFRKNSPYVDVSALSDTVEEDKTTSKARGGVVEPFPEKLHRVLQEVKEAGNSDIVSFLSHGRAFRVHDPDRFVTEIMQKYFKQSRLSSFKRQLNLYGFKRISSGPDAGGYYHELFLEGRPTLCNHMRRVGVPQGEDRRKNRPTNEHVAPNFYAMASLESPKK